MKTVLLIAQKQTRVGISLSNIFSILLFVCYLENCNKNNEPILNTILGLSYATFQQLMGPFGQSSMLNPIDRLYSMQNSYFRPEDLGFSGKDTSEN